MIYLKCVDIKIRGCSEKNNSILVVGASPLMLLAD